MEKLRSVYRPTYCYLQLAAHILTWLSDHETHQLYWKKSTLVCKDYLTIQLNVTGLSIEKSNCNSDFKKTKITQKHLHRAKRSLQWVNTHTFQTLQIFNNNLFYSSTFYEEFPRRKRGMRSILPCILCIQSGGFTTETENNSKGLTQQSSLSNRF